MIVERQRTLSAYLEDLLSSGRVVFSREEALKALSMSRGAFWDSAERLQKRGRLIRPRRGFYVIVPPQFRSWGAPPPAWYIDALMRHEGHPYYVGLLKAAELHGAAHQAVMEFQVVTNTRIPRVTAGRSVLAFYYRRDLDAMRPGIEARKTDTGSMRISCIELTVLDLIRYPHASGGISHIATVFSELGRKIDPGKLAALSGAFERPTVQKAGWLLDHLGFEKRTEKMHRHFLKESQRPWTELEPAIVGDPDLTPRPVEENKRWNLVVRRIPEVDD
jgi:predicted transcriptional regulator of viral defense system